MDDIENMIQNLDFFTDLILQGDDCFSYTEFYYYSKFEKNKNLELQLDRYFQYSSRGFFLLWNDYINYFQPYIDFIRCIMKLSSIKDLNPFLPKKTKKIFKTYSKLKDHKIILKTNYKVKECFEFLHN